jgi:RHS repeat-associated protein
VPSQVEDAGNRTVRSFTFTALGEPLQDIQCIDGETFETDSIYDNFGRPSILVYPAFNGSQLAVENNYTPQGYLQYISDVADGGAYWVADAADAFGNVTRQHTRNGVDTSSSTNVATGWLMSSSTVSHVATDTLIQAAQYHYDQAGNLTFRSRATGLNADTWSESFQYDELNRVTQSNLSIVAQSYGAPKEFNYDAIGNLKHKDGKEYFYDGSCAAGGRNAGPHAICNVAGVSGQFVYDANGNMTTTNDGRTISYNPLNKVVEMHSISPAATIDFIYGADGDRVVQNVQAGTSSARTLYVGLGPTGKSVYERRTKDGVVEHTQFLYAGDAHGGNAFAIRVTTGAAAAAMNYYTFDHLGSVTAMTDDQGHARDASAGADAQIMNYDVWGARRAPDGHDALPGSFNQQVGAREFTGHETIPSIGLINMNGRVYDPALARFLSPDPNVQLVGDLQSYNRYSYALNNPLRNTDPTGYFFDSVSHGYWDKFVLTSLAVVSVIACPSTGGAGCAMAFTIAETAYTVASMANAGSSVEQVVANVSIGIASSAAGNVAGSVAASGISNAATAKIVSGVASGVVSTAMSNALSGRGLGDNVLQGAASGAAMAALGNFADSHPLSRASVAMNHSAGGSGAAAAEVQGWMQAAGKAALRESWFAGDPNGGRPAQAPTAGNFFSDLIDAIKGLSMLGARCASGPCGDNEIIILDVANNHPTAGAQAEFTFICCHRHDPSSGIGGVFGINLQLNLDGLHDSGIFFYYTPAAANPQGLMLGADLGFNMAYGKGSWSGLFDNWAASADYFSGSVFRSPGWSGSGPGYAGVSLGVGAGFPLGAAKYQTNYVPVTGD